VNYVERFALLSGFSVESVEKDYGYDLLLFTYNDEGEIENGNILIQLKATDNIKLVAAKSSISLVIDVADVKSWVKEPMPVVLILYDAVKNNAYWLYVQSYFADGSRLKIRKGQKAISIRFDVRNTITLESMSLFRRLKSDVLAQVDGKIIHDV